MRKLAMERLFGRPRTLLNRSLQLTGMLGKINLSDFYIAQVYSQNQILWEKLPRVETS